MFSCGGLCFGPEWPWVPDVLAKLLEVQDVQVSCCVDQIHQRLGQLGVFVQVLKLERDSCHLVRRLSAAIRV